MSQRLLDALRGMVGLVQLVQDRYPDFPLDNHRVIEALSAINEAEAHVPEERAPLPSDAPRRAVVLDLSLQADSRSEMIVALDNIGRLLAMDQMTRGCSGGPYSGYTYNFEDRGGPTHDEYAQQLKDWLAARSPQNALMPEVLCSTHGRQPSPHGKCPKC